MIENKPHIFAHCAAGCKWEVPHKADIPYKDELEVLYAGNIADENLTDRVLVATIGTPRSQLNNARLMLTLEIYGEQYTVFRKVDANEVLVPVAYARDTVCSFVSMGVVLVANGDKTNIEMYSFENPQEVTVKLLEIAVVELGYPVLPMTGATKIADGRAGVVPAPKAGDQDKVLHGDGTWRSGGGGSVEGDFATEDYVDNAIEEAIHSAIAASY